MHIASPYLHVCSNTCFMFKYKYIFMYLCITFIKLLYNLGLIIPHHTDDDDNKDDEDGFVAYVVW